MQDDDDDDDNFVAADGDNGDYDDENAEGNGDLDSQGHEVANLEEVADDDGMFEDAEEDQVATPQTAPRGPEPMDQ